MKLSVSGGNVDALKIAISANEANVNVGIAHETSVTTLTPCLTDNNGDLKLFMPNAACSYLHESKNLLTKNSLDAVESILEWEVLVLKPVLIPYLQNILVNKKADGMKEEVQARIKSKLLPLLEQNKSCLCQYVSNGTVSVVDIVVWCDLYPLYSDKNLSVVISEIPALKDWMDKLSSRPSFQKGIADIFQVKTPRSWASWTRTSSFKAETGSTTTAARNEDETLPSSVVKVKCGKAEMEEAFRAWSSALNMPKSKSAGGRTILPEKGKRNVLITSALPYVNNVPHLGNIVGAVLSADVFARFCRLRGYNTLYICGTDEYGTSTETKAIEEGLTPSQICDKYNALHSQIYDWFDISFDKFGRTTTEKQTKVAQDIFWSLYKQGNLTEDAMDQLFCKGCDRFLADRYDLKLRVV